VEVDPNWEPLLPPVQIKLETLEHQVGRLEARVEGERFKGPSAALVPWIVLMLLTPEWFVGLLDPFTVSSGTSLVLLIAISALLWILAERSAARTRDKAEEKLEEYEALAAQHPDWDMTPWGDRADRHRPSSRPTTALYLSIIGVGMLQVGDLFMDLGLESLAWASMGGVLLFLVWALLSQRSRRIREDEDEAIDNALELKAKGSSKRVSDGG